MKGMASFVMRGLSQAVMVTSALALLSLIIPLFGILSAASVGLVTLRQGAKSGFRVSLLATLACILFLAVSFGDFIPTSWSLLMHWRPLVGGLGFLLFQWTPILLLGLFLRSSRSLDLTVQLALGFGLLVIFGQYLILGDPSSFWAIQLRPLVEQLVKAGVLDQANSDAVLQQIAGWMPGLLATGLFLQLVFSLLMARWWQSQLYNPGGFRIEFHQFRLHKLFGVAGLPVLVLLMMPPKEIPDLLGYLGGLVLAILFLQGLATIHGILGKAGSGIAWLVGLYLLLLFLPPQAVMVLATLGLMDIWIDFRSRFERGRSTG